jgi:hypothetical protein
MPLVPLMAGAPDQTAARAVVVTAQPLPFQPPFVFVERPPTSVVVAAASSRPPVVVAGQPFPPSLPTVVVVPHLGVAANLAIRPTIITATAPPQTLPFVTVAEIRTDPPVTAPAVPTRSIIARALELAPPAESATMLWTVVSDWSPTRVTVVDAGPIPAVAPFVYVAKARVAPGAPAAIPAKPTIQAAAPPPPALPFVSLPEARVDPAIIIPDAVPRPTITGAVQPIQASPFVEILRANIADGFPAQVTVVDTSQPPQPLPFVYIGEVHLDPPAAPSDAPAHAVIARAIELPPAGGTVFVDQTRFQPPAAAPSVPARPTVTTSLQPPEAVPSATVNWTAAPPPAAPIDHPTSPVVVAATIPPPPPSWSVVRSTPAEPPPVPGAPPRPTVVAVTSVPAPGFVAVSRPVATDQPGPIRPTVITAVKPPELASIVIPRISVPLPILRRPATPIVVDLSPPPPHGRARISHGFAEGFVGAPPVVTNPVLTITPNLADLKITPNQASLAISPNLAELS